MNFQQMRVFNTVAKYKTFLKAATELGISQQTLNVHLTKLEQELDIKLLIKVGKIVRLTDAGLILYEYTDKVLLLTEEAENAVRCYSLQQNQDGHDD